MSISPIPNYLLPELSELPLSRLRAQPQLPRAALLVHDLQEYFLAPYQRELRELLLGRVQRLVSCARLARVPVLFSYQPGQQSEEERGLLLELWGRGILDAPDQAGLCLRTAPEDHLIPKHRYSAFSGTCLKSSLRKLECSELLVCGVYTHIGVLATAVDALSLGFRPHVVVDCTLDFSREDQERGLVQVARTCGGLLGAAPLESELVRLGLSKLLLEVWPELRQLSWSAEDSLEDLGMDSMTGLRFLERLAGLGLEPSFEELEELRSLEDFVRLFLAQLPTLEPWP